MTVSEIDRTIWRELLPSTPVFTTRQVRERTESRPETVSRRLRDLADDGILVRIRRGLWGMPDHPDFSPYAVVPHLFEEARAGYVSLVTALHLHGLIEQIPQTIHVVTTTRRRSLETPVGHYDFHTIAEELFGGFTPYDRQWSFQIARPEKALFDVCYFSVRKGRRFSRLPELAVPDDFDRGEFRHWVEMVEDEPLRRAVQRRGLEVGAIRGEIDEP